MIKFVNVLVRREGLSHEEFVERWTGDHAELASELPGLRRYTTSVPTDPEQSSHDGIVELYFDDMGALGAAFESDAGQAVQDDAAEFVDMERSERLIVEETVQLDETV
ncbi:EthD domain-containing protein [Natrononativus amylolyticus]|uniref:EthD domain-containing protein n=1 Tax=Natrononativus amylolyticus TaxID=2963434 RepID=UPI0020CE516A|nr:EthD domain-containing protein [Natrononativus amylolyticus]